MDETKLPLATTDPLIRELLKFKDDRYVLPFNPLLPPLPLRLPPIGPDPSPLRLGR
jgi:hypothetical protein